MDRRKYILKRLEKELRSLGYEDPFLYREGESFIAVIFLMNEDTPEPYTVQISWDVDDENDRIFFRAERFLQEVCEDDESVLLHFCNEWNKKYFYGRAIYDEDNEGLHLDHTLPLPERVSDMFLAIQVYHHLAFAAENFFKEAEKFNWIPKTDEDQGGDGKNDQR